MLKNTFFILKIKNVKYVFNIYDGDSYLETSIVLIVLITTVKPR